MYLYSGGSRGGARGARGTRPPLSFGPNWGPEGQKNFSGRPAPPYLRIWMTSPPPLISWSWSGTACTCTANATIRTKAFHYNPLPLQPKFRFVDILPIRLFALAKFRGCEFFLRRKFGKMKFRFSGCEISPRWQRNFVWLNENSRALWRNFVAKFRRIFARAKNEKHRI